jgi:hypothetical protein
MEDRIRKLSSQLVAEQDASEAIKLAAQLRGELRKYVEALRAQVADYPRVKERRKLPEAEPVSNGPGS